MTSPAEEIVNSMEFELTELDEALKAFFSLLLNEYTHIQSDGEPRPVPYEVAYTLAGQNAARPSIAS